MKAIAEEIKTVTANDAAPLPSSTGKRLPLFQAGVDGKVALTPASVSPAARSSLTNGGCSSEQILMHGGVEQGESRKSGVPDVQTTATQRPIDVVTRRLYSAGVEANRTAYGDAQSIVDEICGPDERPKNDISRLPYAEAKKLKPVDILEGIQQRIDVANIELQREQLGIESRRMSKITDRSMSFSVGEAESDDETRSVQTSSPEDLHNVQSEHMNDTAPEATPRSSSRNSYSSAREIHNCLDVVTVSQTQATPDTRDALSSMVTISIEADMAIAGKCASLHSGSRSLYKVPTTTTDPARRTRSFSIPREQDAAATLDGSHSSIYLPTDQERWNSPEYRAPRPVPAGSHPRLNANGYEGNLSLPNAIRGTWGGHEAQRQTENDPFQDPSPPEPAQSRFEEQEKAPSTSSSRSCWTMNWKRLGLRLLPVSIFLSFLAAALVTMAKTHTYCAVPSDIFTLSSKTIISLDGSSNLTMSWLNGRAVGFQVNPVYNITLAPDEPKPDALRFTFDWSVDTAGLTPEERKKDTVSSMLIPSFWQKFVEHVAFVGVFAGFCFALQRVFDFISDRWHVKEDGDVYWPCPLLRWFDEVSNPAIIVLGLAGSALLWAGVTRALLLM